MSNRIIVPTRYTLEVTIKYDEVTGGSELTMRSLTRQMQEVNLLKVVALLSEHNNNLIKSIVKGSVKTEVQDAPNGSVETQGGEHAAT